MYTAKEAEAAPETHSVSSSQKLQGDSTRTKRQARLKSPPPSQVLEMEKFCAFIVHALTYSIGARQDPPAERRTTRLSQRVSQDAYDHP